jgi:gluconolactonase
MQKNRWQVHLLCQKISLLSLLVLASQAFGQQPATDIAYDTSATRVSTQFSFTEGPAVDRFGNVFFTDQPNNKIWEYDTAGKLSIFLDTAGRSNGMYFDPEGNLITCADENGQLWSVSPAKKVTVLLKNYQGHQFNGPNDVWVNGSAGIYFTDPYFQRDYWTRKRPDPGIGGEKLYYLAHGHDQPVVVDSDLKKPNGIVGSHDGHLYVSDMGVGKIFTYTINKDGSLSDRKVFATDLADGMTLDDKGDLYLAGRGVTIYNATGQKIRHFNIPSTWTANLCFGGRNRDILFITASESIYIIHMKVKGID